jgi:hypothetical protein
MRVRLIVKCLIVTTVLGVLMPAGASAASVQGTSLSTSPVSVDLHGQPGTSVTTTFQVENNQTVPVLISVQLETFRADGTSGQAQIIPPSPDNPSLNWVSFSKTEFIAQPNVWTPVQMTINLPRTAALDYYYAVLFKPAVSVTKGKDQDIVKSENAILVLLDADNGTAKPHLEVTGFTASKKLYEYLPANFSVTVRNDGNVYLPPNGDIFISRSSNFSSTIATLPVNSYAGNVLPGTTRIYTEQWSSGFPVFTPKMIDGQTTTDKNGQVVQQLKWDFSKANEFRFGEYYAKLVLAYNNGSRDIPIQASLSFWVIPWKLITITLLVIIFVAIGLYVSGEKVADRAYKISKRVRRSKRR